MEDRAIADHIRERMHGGRRALARAVDYIALRLILFLAAYLQFLPRVATRATACLLASIALAMAMIMLHMAGELRYARCRKKEIEHVRGQLLQDALMRLDMQTAIPLVSALCPLDTSPVVLLTALPVDANALLSAVRSHRGCGELHVFACAGFDESANAFSARTNGQLVLHPKEEMYKAAIRAGMQPQEEAVYDAMRARIRFEKAQTRRRRPTLWVAGGARRYAVIALSLTALSFFTGYSLYYRMLAGACMTVAALCLLRTGAHGAH